MPMHTNCGRVKANRGDLLKVHELREKVWVVITGISEDYIKFVVDLDAV